jgi:hypothetical protein
MLSQADGSALQGQGRAGAPSPGITAIRGATILTVTHGTVPNGTIVLRDGKIAAVGIRSTRSGRR